MMDGKSVADGMEDDVAAQQRSRDGAASGRRRSREHAPNRRPISCGKRTEHLTSGSHLSGRTKKEAEAVLDLILGRD
jgi:hypothetical protein